MIVTRIGGCTTQSFNRYSYTHSVPVNFNDPSGLEESRNCYINGIPTPDCGLAISLINSRAGYPADRLGGFYLEGRLFIGWQQYSSDYGNAIEGHSGAWFAYLTDPGQAIRQNPSRTPLLNRRAQANKAANDCASRVLGRWLGKEALTFLKETAANAGVGLGVLGAIAFAPEALTAIEGGTVVDVLLEGLTKAHAAGYAMTYGGAAVVAAVKLYVPLVTQSFSNKAEAWKELGECAKLKPAPPRPMRRRQPVVGW